MQNALLEHEKILKLLVYDSRGADNDSKDPSRSPKYSKLVDGGKLALTHLHLLKYAYQRVGEWPYASEHERLNEDVFKTFSSELKGVEGMEKWHANGFGGGKAESTEGSFPGLKSWELEVID